MSVANGLLDLGDLLLENDPGSGELRSSTAIIITQVRTIIHDPH